MGLIDFLNVLLRLNIPLFCVLMFMKGRNCHCHPGSSEISLSGQMGSFPCLWVPFIFHSSKGPCSFHGQQSHRKNRSAIPLCLYFFLRFPNFGKSCWHLSVTMEKCTCRLPWCHVSHILWALFLAFITTGQNKGRYEGW